MFDISLSTLLSGILILFNIKERVAPQPASGYQCLDFDVPYLSKRNILRIGHDPYQKSTLYQRQRLQVRRDSCIAVSRYKGAKDLEANALYII